jgi:hypothetical protein
MKLNKKTLVTAVAAASLLGGCAQKFPTEQTMEGQARDNAYVASQGMSFSTKDPKYFQTSAIQSQLLNVGLTLDKDYDGTLSDVFEAITPEVKEFINTNYGTSEEKLTPEIELNQAKAFAVTKNNDGTLNFPIDNTVNKISSVRLNGDIIGVQITPGISPSKVSNNPENLEGIIYSVPESMEIGEKSSWEIPMQPITYLSEVVNSNMTSLSNFVGENYHAARRSGDQEAMNKALASTLTSMYELNPKLAQDLVWESDTYFKYALSKVKMNNYKLNANIKDLTGITFWTSILATGTTNKIIDSKTETCYVVGSGSGVGSNALGGATNADGTGAVVGTLTDIFGKGC